MTVVIYDHGYTSIVTSIRPIVDILILSYITLLYKMLLRNFYNTELNLLSVTCVLNTLKLTGVKAGSGFVSLQPLLPNIFGQSPFTVSLWIL